MVTELRDPVSEQSLIAIALQSGSQLPKEFLNLNTDSFDNWENRAIASVIRQIHSQGKPNDPEVVMREVINRAGTDSRARVLGTLVANLYTRPVQALSAPYYAERVAAFAAARKAAIASSDFARQVEYAALNDDAALVSQANQALRERIDDVERTFHPTDVEPPISVGELISIEVGHDWLIPELFEHGDRLVVTGYEGHGKSVLLAQLAMCVGGGVHPFSRQVFNEGYQVLILDVENSLAQLRRRYRRIALQIDKIRLDEGQEPVDWRSVVRVISRPDGINLIDLKELSRLRESLDAVAPVFVVAGPLYKLSELSSHDEQAAKDVTSVLDKLRVEYGFTLVCEAHGGHMEDGNRNRKLRPIGSSLFLRWPEFGWGIAPSGEAAQAQEHPSLVELRHWRGSRDERNWPTLLKHGQSLPWEPANPEYWDLPEERREWAR